VKFLQKHSHDLPNINTISPVSLGQSWTDFCRSDPILTQDPYVCASLLQAKIPAAHQVDDDCFTVDGLVDDIGTIDYVARVGPACSLLRTRDERAVIGMAAGFKSGLVYRYVPSCANTDIRRYRASRGRRYPVFSPLNGTSIL